MKTNLDLHLSAATAAQASVEVRSEFDADAAAMAAFRTLALNPIDWPDWKQFFGERRKAYQQLATQTPKSIIAEQRMKGRVLNKAPEPINPPKPNTP